MPSKISKHFNSDDYDCAATYVKLHQKNLYTTNDPTHEHGNKTNHNREPLMPIPQIIRACQNIPPQEVRTEQILKQTSNLDIPRILHVNRIQPKDIEITRTLRDIKSQQSWHSIRVSPLVATYKNKIPWSKITQNTLQDQDFFRASPLDVDENKTSRLKINCALLQDAPTYLQPTNKPTIKNIRSSPRPSAAKQQVRALAIKMRLPK